MTNVLSALLTYFNSASSGPLTNTITGGLHLEEAPPQTVQPYCVMSVIGAPSTGKYGSAPIIFSEPQIQFTVYGTGAASTLALMDNATTGLIAKFDAATFALASGQVIHALRLHDPVPISPEPNEANVPVYGWSVSYRFASTA